MPTPGPIEISIRNEIRRNRRIVAALIDPEDFSPTEAVVAARVVQKAGGSLILVGGSTLANQTQLDDVVIALKRHITLPITLFPGNITGVSRYADAILFMSLLNSSNPYFITGAQAMGAIQVRKYNLEAIPMGYLVVGRGSTTAFIADIREIPANRPEIAVMYALAAQYMGMRALYLEAGSGAQNTVEATIIKEVKKHFKGILFAGGGITTPEAAAKISQAGADILVVGNLLKEPAYKKLFQGIVEAVRQPKKNN